MAENIKKISYCPNCGADCRDIVYGDIEHNKCLYCGHELYDYSVLKNQAKIKDVESKRKKLLGIPMSAAITIIVTLLVLLVGVAIFYMSGASSAVENQILYGASNKYTKKMESCYKKKDWDGLYKLVIEDCDKSINSSYYFTYRTAWILSCYPDDFDKAYASGNLQEMKDIYKFISEDYEMRSQDIFDAVYDTVGEIEDNLKAEYERETAIMETLEE